ncbi:sulfatase maturation enzyme AslB (radical SAM superfamily) [Actinoplanes campanulatus]|uniref:Sulfatase maturation enzyme AslB (Radical SAM superfamily) n=1 Tax=Actinoplanes campanulatus TaxID=113559 RepID=A0A7W5ASD8_9ACTN|nr:radical SAM/SPASM domain-containing protein [Actinoplanes campanulatus]MBB3100984.1 sulfatase maturation enzyme AslB (radical SAM superfamily) [Actinoplanes campanulatus]GGN49098.1 hypothetical protein GCM10010109_86770 [Actinoplanes campanulatus]GID41802.1 hypothetical protein Aca09nite_83080 [Actinoplanes campanulatus]
MIEVNAATPIWIWLDSAATCNIACKLCYTTPMRSPSFMPLELFTGIVDAVRAAPVEVIKFHLNWRGEPVSNPRLAQMLSILSRHPWPVEWHTNATMLTRRKAAAVVESHPGQRIMLSLDGGNRSSFEANRGAGTWSRALRGAEALLDARNGRPNPSIGIHQLDLGVDPRQWETRFHDIVSRVDQHVIEKPVDLDGAVVGHQPVAIPDGPCFWMGNILAIDVNGDAWTCLLRNGTRLGSVIAEGVQPLLDRARTLRQRVAHGTRAAVPGCATCRKKEGHAWV